MDFPEQRVKPLNENNPLPVLQRTHVVMSSIPYKNHWTSRGSEMIFRKREIELRIKQILFCQQSSKKIVMLSSIEDIVNADQEKQNFDLKSHLLKENSIPASKKLFPLYCDIR